MRFAQTVPAKIVRDLHLSAAKVAALYRRKYGGLPLIPKVLLAEKVFKNEILIFIIERNHCKNKHA